jgi:hypothetical protein
MLRVLETPGTNGKNGVQRTPIPKWPQAKHFL